MDTLKPIYNPSSKLIKSTPKDNATFDIVITKEVEAKIRYLCSKIHNIEWSGFLFYTYEGNIKNNNLKIICKDIYLKDIGSSGYTEFDTSLDETAYMVDKDLLDCQTGLIHSHHTMAAFFSGTDLNTLASEGLATNSFVSLIVNNEGKYVAAVTERIKTHTKKHIITTSYSFADTPTTTTEEVENFEDLVKYYDLKIIKETTEITDLDDRIAEIKKAKTPTVVAANNYENLALFQKPTSPIYTHPLTEPVTKEKTISFNTDLLVAQLLTMSLCINALKFDIKNWVSKMDNVYARVFPDMEDFYTWGDTYVDYLVCSTCSQEPTADNMSIVATSMFDVLAPYEDNKYVCYYMDMLHKYIEQ